MHILSVIHDVEIQKSGTLCGCRLVSCTSLMFLWGFACPCHLNLKGQKASWRPYPITKTIMGDLLKSTWLQRQYLGVNLYHPGISWSCVVVLFRIAQANAVPPFPKHEVAVAWVASGFYWWLPASLFACGIVEVLFKSESNMHAKVTNQSNTIKIPFKWPFLQLCSQKDL